MKVDIVESTIVRPAQNTPNRHLWLSNLDLLVPRVHFPNVYFYKSDGSPNFFGARVLKEAMSKLLVPFYPVAGRLETDESGRIQINCNGEGVLFIQAQADLTLDDFGDFTPDSDKIKQLIPYVDYTSNISSYPLIVIQVTFLKCGGVCLGVGWHHMLVDGTAAINFINTWSDMARGLSITTPLIDRTILRARDPPNPKFNHTELHKPPSVINPRVSLESQASKKETSTAIFKITLDQLNILKTKARGDGNSNSAIKFSTFAVLSAHIWRCVCKSRDLPDDEATAFYIPTDGRPRLCPALPRSYLGNAVFGNNVIASSGDIRLKPLAHTAERIHEAVQKRDDEYLRSHIDYLEAQPDITALRRGAHTYACPNLNVSSLIRMPLYDADFGWGQPIHAGLASVVCEGNVFILPNPAKDGSLSLALCLETHHMKRFQWCLYDF